MDFVSINLYGRDALGCDGADIYFTAKHGIILEVTITDAQPSVKSRSRTKFQELPRQITAKIK